ncbi:hypothetical protein VA596_27335 [Amycolatopsis sp., V23-08]|uniref:YbaB/EbfC family nucleoid-associated protein n=1 Tax=Amycolatopsis heterodermiae TaxID=3110235 RepID=A0ABU5RCC2_9PSEU|nr:hypothetical protein [Amycolatopsis sp., V23-08]MEA5363274.1 hypothetical protein [Amycolatopsis sp., V23-08]
MSAERTAVELADDAFAAPDPGYGARLASIRAAAAADGVSVVVDLHGSLVDLRFDRWALNRSPGELSAVVKRLAAEAAADALRQGREVLGELLPAEREWGPETRPVRSGEPYAEQAWGPETRPVRLARPVPEEDSFTPSKWAT